MEGGDREGQTLNHIERRGRVISLGSKRKVTAEMRWWLNSESFSKEENCSGILKGQ